MNKKDEMENKDDFNINYYENIVQDLQYTNSVLNNRNIALETELEIIKNKYNLYKQDLNEINKHISICKDTQEKIIKDLKERNDFLEKLYITKDYNNIKREKENLNNKNTQDKLHEFVEKMKILFGYDTKEEINDEDYLDILGNNIIKLNENFLLNRNELNKKIHEINKLKHEIQNMKLNSDNFNNNFEINLQKNYARVKTPLGKNKFQFLNNNKNLEIFQKEDISNSPNSFRKKYNNNISIPKTPQINPQIVIDIPFNQSINKKINIDKKLVNSHSLNSYKFKTLKESEKDKKYFYPKENLNNNNNLDSNDLIQSLMNNVKHLENTYNKRPNQK